MPSQPFAAAFKYLTENDPFPWQSALYERFTANNIPVSANIPTGLGKTSVIAVWLIALARHPDRVPRRLVYVVNRRTVVDQTTTEVEHLRNALGKPELTEVRNALAALCALPLPTIDSQPLAISTLRGQFADNGDWCVDPSRPAVIAGTVDMIGSGLLFSRYTRGFKTRPLHAGFLGQDALLVHDEAHLEPAFQTLLESIASIQRDAGDQRKLQVLELSATNRAANTSPATKPFGLDENPNDKDTDNHTVKKRIKAVKKLALIPVTKIEDGKDKAKDGTIHDEILKRALAKKDNHRAVLVFVRTVDAAVKITGALAKEKCSVATLTGTMRGKERDELVSKNPVFQRFLPENDRASSVTPATGTVFLVATSAGEVGVNMSADVLICDLTTYESMAQRFGRVNRFGDHDDSEITVFYRENLQANYDEGLEQAASAKKDTDKKIAAYHRKKQSVLRVIKTLSLMKQLAKLGGSASPAALDKLPSADRVAAFSPPPVMRVATDVQFDAWTLTSIRSPIAARPTIVPYLHGEAEWQPPETHVAWREELDVLGAPELREAYPPAELLEVFPLKPHELLRDTSERIHDQLVRLLDKLRANGAPIPDAWLIRENGDIKVFPLMSLLAAQESRDDDEDEEAEEGAGETANHDDKVRKKRVIALIANATLILPESLGGIEKGLFTPNTPGDDADVADIPGQRLRVWSDSPEVPAVHADGFRLVCRIDTRLAEEDADDFEDHTDRYWLWLEGKPGGANGARSKPATAETLADHTAAVTANAAALAAKLCPAPSAIPVDEPDLRRCVIVAARLHDLGKNRAQWQRNLGNLAYDPANAETILAKSAPGMRPRTVAEHYRHEFGSLNDAFAHTEFSTLNEAEREIVLHIVAAHHGRARPHFPADEIGDNAATPTADTVVATEIPRRFARLQKRFGRWGLAWLESILRAADYAASAGLVAAGHTAPASDSTQTGQPLLSATTPQPTPTASLTVNPANPGHYFACCGLFELASCFTANGGANAPAALAWFEHDPACRQWRFHLANTPSLAGLLKEVTAAEIIANDTDDRAKSSLKIRLSGGKANLRLDWWRHEGSAIGKLKPWAGNTSVCDIADDMCQTLKAALAAATEISAENVLFTTSTANSGEPFYFDANRAINARAQDVGFSADKLRKGGIHIATNTAPAVELLALVGLQRARPPLAVNRHGREREYNYHIWQKPLPITLLAAAVSGSLPDTIGGFRFSNPSRAKDYRAFSPANRFL